MKTFNRMKNKIKSAKTEFLFVFFSLSAGRLMAQDGAVPSQMTDLVANILAIFTGPVVKTILIIMLAACAVVYGFNKDNEKIKRNVLAIGVATAIVAASSFVVGLVWGSGDSVEVWA
jgi:type IV secretory pathway VirB2 component (pilin)